MKTLSVYGRSLGSGSDLYGRSCAVTRNPEKRKVGGSTPPLTSNVNCADVRLVIVRAQFVMTIVSFLGQLLRANRRIGAGT